ncbi:MAG: beta-galactosidase [Bacteroidales bacterium]|nr:beta-galactosidase [Bacteroidales bacterium]
MKYTIVVILTLTMIICKKTDTSDLFVADVSNPVIKLNGIWKVNLTPPEGFWKSVNLNDNWKDIQVPGECMMQGFLIKHDKPFAYKRMINIPDDYKNKTIFLQFDGVYSYARVWLNGNYICDHSGGFTRWSCDISSFVTPGESAMLTVEVTDKADEISYASGYAKHQIGGILRDVKLLALPDNYPEDITIKTDFDENFQNASLIISGKTKKIVDNSKLTLELFDKSNEEIGLENNSLILNDKHFVIKNQIISPLKWDAEHPNLYKLKISYSENDKLVWEKVHKIGFREITLKGNKLLVNGNEVKLRGANRHDIHPLLGRISTPEYELKDVKLAKEANINFIRTSHYPPTDNFLCLCDEHGIYVEDETAVCFVGSHRTKEYRPGASENKPDFTDRYLAQLKEMVSNHKNHPSVLIWSIGNENHFGTNFKKSYKWVKRYDETRPVIFSYPGYVPDRIQAFDILSMHYPGISGSMNQIGKITDSFGYNKIPVIFDEWAHVACYNNFTVIEDPNIRDFWGTSLDSMWQKTFEADGGLGGAIWCMIDETFMLPDSLPGFNEWWGIIDENVIPAEYSGNTVGCGEWGIIDTWRRKKPEFWNTKKAYSPIKLSKTQFEHFSNKKPVLVPIYNRFNHTNIDELTIQMEYKGEKTILKSPHIEPHSKGELVIALKEWDFSEPILLEFFKSGNELIDKYSIKQETETIAEKNSKLTKSIYFEETATTFSVICENETKIIFDKNTGLMKMIQTPTGNIAISGPAINLRTKGKPIIYSYHQINNYANNWQLEQFDFEQSSNSVNINIHGNYNDLPSVVFNLRVFSNGEIMLKYNIDNVPQEYVREIGVKFDFEDIFDSISWDRNPYWSYYPANHLSAKTGIAAIYSDDPKTYRNAPSKEWNQDNKSFYYCGTANETQNNQITNIARSTKENILTYSLMINNQPIISVIGEGNISCRIAKTDNTIQHYANNEIDYIDLSWGNFQRNIKLNMNYSNELVYKINTHSNILYK